MGGVTYVVVTDPGWAFDRERLFGALATAFDQQTMSRDSDLRRLRADGWLDGFTIEVLDEPHSVIVSAPAMRMVELVTWVRAYVPAEVPLEVFDSDTTFEGPRPLPAGITVDQLISDYWPDVPALDAEARASKPPHLP